MNLFILGQVSYIDNDKAWKAVTVKVNNPKDVHALWLNFPGDGDDLYRIDSFKFDQ
jgi:hypothetical protein